ncbi:MAG: hydroxymethylbilane synthase [Bdellovibrionota bacterium]
MRTLKLGTRKSLLAWAQSSWVARELERLNAGLRVELVGIETRGDRIQNVPLTEVNGKEFFVAELDDALKSAAVDLNVHSMKDLSLDRPREFVLGAVPPRENPRDVVLFSPGIIEKIRSGRELRIGTSSPRRLENIPAFLARALPQIAPGGVPKLRFLEIRGNVNTRLSRVREPEGSERQLDAVVLAFAGLIRLWNDEKGRAELTGLLAGVRWMVLPLRECPAAPAQGALAVECRADDSFAREALSKLHHAPSEHLVRAERQLLADWGGGCHQRFGATAMVRDGVGELLFVRGAKPSGEFVDELWWKEPASGEGGPAWDGAEWRCETGVEELPGASEDLGGRALFAANSRALRPGQVESAASARIWVSGVQTWMKFARLGLWVEGCAENLGFDLVEGTLAEPVLQLPPSERWTILTHDRAASGWGERRILATYRVPASYSEGAIAALRAAKHVFWSSGSQWDELNQFVRKEAVVACGAGKTAAHLRAQGVRPLVFPSAKEWRAWLNRK